MAAFADLDPETAGYWYGSAETPDQRGFAARFPAFVSALDAALVQAGHLRSFTAANP
jgi:hypothetical protein